MKALVILAFAQLSYCALNDIGYEFEGDIDMEQFKSKVKQLIEEEVAEELGDLRLKVETMAKRLGKKVKRLEEDTESIQSEIAEMKLAMDGRVSATKTPDFGPSEDEDGEGARRHAQLNMSLGPADEKEFCNISYAGVCYWVLYDPLMTYGYAVSRCTAEGLEPADIPSKEVYDMLLEFARKNNGRGSYYTGMMHDYATGKIQLSTGQEAKYVKRHPSPFGDHGALKAPVTLVVQKEPSDANQGMSVISPPGGYLLTGIICQSEA